MSLLGSIFGEQPKSKTSQRSDDKDHHQETVKKPRKKSKKPELEALFHQQQTLPDRPNHAPVAPGERRKRKQEAAALSGSATAPTALEEQGFEEDELAPKRKKKTKQKRTKAEREQQEKREAAGDKDKKDTNEDETGTRNDEVITGNSSGNQNTSSAKEEDRTIFVGNLPLISTTRRSLAAIFKDCGSIQSTRIRGVPVQGIKLPPQRAGDQNLMRKVCVNTKLVDDSTQKQTVQGYVVFKDMKSIALALKKNNTFHEGYYIRVDTASPTVDPSRSVFCGNLPYGADERSLQQHFEKGCDLSSGDVVGARIVRDKETFQCKGFGYVLFREKTIVPLALKLHGTTYLKKTMRVQVCGKRFKGKKGQNVPKYKSIQSQEKVTIGAFRRIIAKQATESTNLQKRKRGEKKKQTVTKKGGGNSHGLSKRAALEKKVEKKVKKLQKRAAKGMGKTKN